jgi:hypothetical protein
MDKRSLSTQEVDRIYITRGPRRERSRKFREDYHHFRNDLFVLREVNKELPESIRGLAAKRKADLTQSLAKMTQKDSRQLDKVVKFLGRSSKVSMPKRKGREISIGGPAAKALQTAIDTLRFENRSILFIRDMSLVYLIATFRVF